MASPIDFKELFLQENELLAEDPGSTGDKSDLRDRLKTETPGPAGEPWIRYTPIDRVGLAFSGGGIRSATFNLGVLKALHELGLLKHVDYLSTVSGGGYIGAWWTAWRARWGKEFPETGLSGLGDRQQLPNREPEEVRHLREFSDFLSPRIGFFESETWNAIMAVLSAMLPAMLVASSVIALAFLVWLGVNSLILASALGLPVPGRDWLSEHGLSWMTGRELAPVVLSVVTIITYICFEWSWHCAGKAEKAPSRSQVFRFHFWMSVSIVFGICMGWQLLMHARWTHSEPPNDVGLWQWSTGISPGGHGFSFSPHLFDAPILWAGVALVVFVPRLLIMRFGKVSVSSKIVSVIDRALSRVLGAAVVVTALGVLWLAGCWLSYTSWGTKAVPAGGALLSGGAFTLLRNWIGRLGPAKKRGVMDMVKPLIPQILAYVAIALWAICVAALLARCIKQSDSSSCWLLFAIAFGIVVFAILFFDPAQVSMHSFYRNRLTRAYLGASNLDAKKSSAHNRQTDVRLHDDIQLRALSPTATELAADKSKTENERTYSHEDSASRIRPLHLVCCAANDIGGDHLENLSRGSRSAVLSKIGFAIGNYWKMWETDRESLGVGSAITASAAAFNSNMGSITMTLGAGVTFLCTALNLRLGLWLGHPLSNKIGVPKWTPGRLFLKEMFGLTNSGLRPAAAAAPPKPVAKYVHLSDGAHFENLALYELVRRHCRYIIVSDCGADPEVAFDDFGNAVRRIREDFGVEIDIDLSSLKPNAERISKQHVAVGIVSYDPRGDRKDNAILFYLKPALTGDEPCDITQYRTRNADFPHESTGDQFYDEAQWESYRRLGEHAAYSALRFVERERQRDDLSADEIFNGARWEWYQSPERRGEQILELTGRLTALEKQLREAAPADFIREMYPELDTFGKKNDQDKVDQSKTPVVPPKPEEIGQTLHFLIQMIQLMEDVWFASYLETHWNDPNNLGWMNTFQRWAYTPSFRLWWPILKPMYGRKFRRFMEERLSLADEDYPPTDPEVINRGENPPAGVAQIYWKRMHEQDPEHGKGKTVYSYDLKLTLQSQHGKDTCYEVQAGLAFLDLSDKTLARWNVEDFFVPPSLWGAGLGAKFLNELLAILKKEGVKRCEVSVEPPPKKTDDEAVEWLKRTDVASRQQLNDLLAFYQRANFTLDTNNRLVRDLEDI
jgi:GNAT superfamily N-acetyltransferase